jgi:hypothetical protein
VVQVGYSYLETGCHGELICIQKQFVRQRRPKLEKLKTAEVICPFHERSKLLPAIEDLMVSICAQYAIPE